ncbi:Sin3 histone deacetylase corepressor complex component SDS3 [Amphibalanus amphitrite]|uniref:Sin3 histone deacetylase corepressor complex component SDS3 n=1 Tax=Amphibalanus amphitrite TaxID=1232801 RepID=A0A6A4VXF6_AMPAM|nr:sin3 histone deacetylase corepressor complex component SDS3-like [Amphibalanus amphitrite]KAF0294548.1 Sin3 histone deacetylase corepressor complex component SDS3 [Amphibalanus amphitrite]
MASPRSPFLSSHVEDCDMDDQSDEGDGDGQPVGSNDEDTDDASETESQHRPEGEITEIKERIYLDKLANLKAQLQQLAEGTHPEYNKKLKRLDNQHKERIRLTELWFNYERKLFESECERDRRALTRELEERRTELRESLIAELEDKRRLVEMERASMEITGDSMDMKPPPTRKLRRRPNDPVPAQEKRRKPVSNQLNFQLDEKQMEDDLRLIAKGKLPTQQPAKKSSFMPESSVSPAAAAVNSEIRIEDNKLFLERKWFHRGQPVYVESRDNSRYSAVISAISADAVWVRKTADNSKARIYLSHLQRGKCSIKRRAS